MKDPRKKELLIKKLGIGDPEASRAKTNAGVPTDKESGGGKESASDGITNQHLTPSGKYAGGWAMPPPFFAGWPWMGMAPFSGAPQTTNCAPTPGSGGQGQSVSSSISSNPGPSASISSNPGPSGLATQTVESEEESENEDVVQLLDRAEALELVEFDPTVDPKDSWKPSQMILSFL